MREFDVKEQLLQSYDEDATYYDRPPLLNSERFPNLMQLLVELLKYRFGGNLV